MTVAEEPPAQPAFVEPGTGLHQPWRLWAAALELVLAVALGVTAIWAWRHGFVPISLPGPNGAVDVVTRLVGSWLSLGILAGACAALLLVDMVRQLVLGVRVRRRSKRRDGR